MKANTNNPGQKPPATSYSIRPALLVPAGALALIVIAVGGVIDYRARHGPITTPNSNSNTPADAKPSPDLSNKNAPVTYDDDKHKLFQAAGLTRDRELGLAVLKKLGFLKPDGTVTEDYPKFVDEHFAWAKQHQDFISSVNNV